MDLMGTLVTKVNRAAGVVSGVCVIAAAALIIAEIVVRSFMQSSLYVADEYTGYLMAVSSVLGLGYVQHRGGHIRMDLVDLLAKRSPQLLRALRALSYIAAIAAASCIAWVAVEMEISSIQTGVRSMQISETPLWIPRIFIAVGAVLLLLQYVVDFIAFMRGKSEK